MKIFSWDSFFATIFVFLLMIIFPLAFNFQIFSPLKHALSEINITDVVFSDLRDETVIKGDDKIVIVNILGINTLDLARIINIINQNNPEVLALDKVLDSYHDPAEMDILSQVIAESNNPIVASRFVDYNEKREKYMENLQNPELITLFANQGFTNVLIGKDQATNTVRYFHAFAAAENAIEPSLPYLVAQAYDPDSDFRFRKDPMRTELIKYKGNWNKFSFIDGYDVMDGNFADDFFKGKIILLGDLYSNELSDMYFTPLNDSRSGGTMPDMYEVVVHANIISMMLDRDYYTKAPFWLAILIAFIFCYINMSLFQIISNNIKSWYEIFSLIIFVLESMVLLYASVMLFSVYDFQIELTPALFAIALSVLIFEAYTDTVKPLTLKAWYILTKSND